MWGGRSKLPAWECRRDRGGGGGGRTGERLSHSPHPKTRGRRGYLGWWGRAAPPERSVRRERDAVEDPLPRGGGHTHCYRRHRLSPRSAGASRRQQLRRRQAGAPPGMLQLGRTPQAVGETPKWGSPIGGGGGGHTHTRAAGRATPGSAPPTPPGGAPTPPRPWGKRGAGAAPAEPGHPPPPPTPPAPRCRVCVSPPPSKVPTCVAAAKSLATRSGHRGLRGAPRAPGAPRAAPRRGDTPGGGGGGGGGRRHRARSRCGGAQPRGSVPVGGGGKGGLRRGGAAVAPTCSGGGASPEAR